MYKKLVKTILLISASYMFWLYIFAIPLGFSAATFTYSKGYSYLSNDPKACINCHIMNEQYFSWEKSKHRHVAVCNDCHTPDNIILKYTSKVVNGWNHGVAFTTNHFAWPIQIKQFNRDILNHSCFKCHEQITDHINTKNNNCLHCHSDVGHGK